MRRRRSLTLYNSMRSNRKKTVYRGTQGRTRAVEDREFRDKRKLAGTIRSESVSYVAKGRVGTTLKEG
jgi:hypothetical protein